MTKSGQHDTEDIVRYAAGELSEQEQRVVQLHMQSCPECTDFLVFVQEFHSAARQAKVALESPGEPCPAPSLLVALDQDELDESTAQQVRAHLLFCGPCLEEYFLLRTMPGAELLAQKTESWQLRMERLRDLIIDFGRNYGPGSLFGAVRVIAEGPAFAVRGQGVSGSISKVLEASVGDNVYSLEIGVASDSSLSIEIAGHKISTKNPLSLAVESETGNLLLSARTDDFGNGGYVIPASRMLAGLYILSLKLGNEELEVSVQFPENQASA